jgi:two-component system, LuxR family, response regulator FixJ
MVVEDDADNLESMVDLLETEGYEVVAARTGQEACALVETTNPCLILIDYLLPDITGAALLDVLRARPGDSIPVVILTGIDPLVDPVDAPVLSKPVAVDDLLGALRQYCPPVVPQRTTTLHP